LVVNEIINNSLKHVENHEINIFIDLIPNDINNATLITDLEYLYIA